MLSHLLVLPIWPKHGNPTEHTHDFRKRALLLGINLNSQDTLLKYIGGLHSYLKHNILMFNPKNLDEVCVQATHLEARGKQGIEEKSESEGKGKGKFYGRGKRDISIKKEKEKLTCKNCSNIGHDEDQCWKLHPELKPNKLKAKEKEIFFYIVEHDLGSDSGDETNIIAMGYKGKHVESNSSSKFSNDTHYEDTRI